VGAGRFYWVVLLIFICVFSLLFFSIYYGEWIIEFLISVFNLCRENKIGVDEVNDMQSLKNVLEENSVLDKLNMLCFHLSGFFF
jgi:1,4-dihydroxy-2-naphthoate octaprenyltransferase